MSTPRHSAPGSNAGFSYQFERALHWLAQSPSGAAIGIETDDDVAVRTTDTAMLEQDKHSIQENAEPFGDRSKDLWNTLAIWVEALEIRQVAADSTTFLMVTNKVLPDCIARQIDAAESPEKVEACISALETAGRKPPAHIAALVDRVLRDESRATLRALLPRVHLADGAQATAGAALRKQTIDHLQLPGWCATHVDSIADELLGWLHKSALAAWQARTPAWIQRDHFVNQMHAVLDRRRRQISRERAENLIPVTSDHVGQEKGRPFVKQLHLVTNDDTAVDNYIREFIRCNIEKIRLSKEGNITDADWTAFEATLLSRWQKIRGRVLRMRAGAPEEDVGFEILTESTDDYREKLAGADTEQVYLTSGTYHRLADLLRVGWHPRFEAIMQELLKS